MAGELGIRLAAKFTATMERRRFVGLTRQKTCDVPNESDDEHASSIEPLKPVKDRISVGNKPD